MKTRPASIAILSEQTLFRRGLAGLLHAQGFHRLAEYATSSELRAAARAHAPEVVVVDLDHEHHDTRTLMRSLRHELGSARLVVIGTALRQGASDSSWDAGVETPRADVAALTAATLLGSVTRRLSVESARQHRLWERVTPRQRDVMRWLALGADNAVIARKLHIGERAVKVHITALLALFGLHNRTQLALVADRAGVRPPLRARV